MRLVVLAPTLPPEIDAEVLVKPPVVRLKVAVDVSGDSVHRWVLALLRGFPRLRLPLGEVKETQDEPQAFRLIP